MTDYKTVIIAATAITVIGAGSASARDYPDLADQSNDLGRGLANAISSVSSSTATAPMMDYALVVEDQITGTRYSAPLRFQKDNEAADFKRMTIPRNLFTEST